MPTEEQLQGVLFSNIVAADSRYGQRLTINNRKVTKLSFYTGRNGDLPSVGVDFVIHRVSDGSLINTKQLCANAQTFFPIKGVFDWHEVTFDTPVVVNEEVRIVIYAYGSFGSGGIAVWRTNNNDVKPGERATHYPSGVWTDIANGDDFKYIYTYELPIVAAAPGLNPALIELLE